MPLGIIFWVIMIVWLLFGLWSGRTESGWNYTLIGGSLIIWVLLALLGWHDFGSMVK